MFLGTMNTYSSRSVDSRGFLSRILTFGYPPLMPDLGGNSKIHKFSKKNSENPEMSPQNSENPKNPEFSNFENIAPTPSYIKFLGTRNTYSSRSVDFRGLFCFSIMVGYPYLVPNMEKNIEHRK